MRPIPPRRPPPRRYPPAVYFRRRLAVGLSLALLIAVVVGIFTLVSGPKAASPTTTTTTTSHSSTSTAPSNTHVGIGLRTVVWVDTNPAAGGVANPLPNGEAGPRKLVTEIWYPALGASKSQPTTRARPDYARGPFPVVVFAHGFDTLPATYSALLSSWVNAGYVVVAPLFPDENANLISSLGDATTQQLSTAESDIVNEPYDIAYVVGEVESGAGGAASSGAAWLKGLVEPNKFALVGHSDGAQAVAALVYAQAQGQAYATTYAGLPARPFAVIILSGSELSGSYAAPADAPPLLLVQSAVDDCNLASNAVTLLHDAGGGFFLKLLDANHFGPYVGQGRAAGIVEKITVAFRTRPSPRRLRTRSFLPT